MASVASKKERYFRRQAFYMLVLAGVVFVVWFVLWLAMSTPSAIQNAKDNSKATSITEAPTHIDSMGELDKEVPPIDFATLVQDFRTYPAEFKDKRYFDNKNYTIELMNVSQNDIIVSYLNSRKKDRSRFAYLRYLDNNQNPRYILTYGKFVGEDEARTAAKSVNFDLPASVVPNVVVMSNYLKNMDNYERDEIISDANQKLRLVRLQPTNHEIRIQAATFADEELAAKSREQAQENIFQDQLAGNDTAVNMTDGNFAQEPHKDIKTQPSARSKSEPTFGQVRTTTGRIETSNEPKQAPIPMVNTSKVPGSE